MQDNRYAVSPAVATQADHPPGGIIPYAGFWRRAGAYVLDYILISIVAQIGVLAVGGPGRVLLGIAAILYYPILESSSMQATLGKRVFGIKVTDLHGERIGFGRAFGRLFGHILSFLMFGVGFAMAVFTERRQTLHDKMAGTLVVNREEPPEAIDRAGAAPPVPMWLAIVAVLGLMLFGPFGIGILAAISIPAYQDYVIRAQVTEGLNIAAPYQADVEKAVAHGAMLESSEWLAPDTSKYVDTIQVVENVIYIHYGRAANKKIAGGHLLLLPGMRGRSVQWFCGHVPPMPDVTVSIPDYEKYTDIPDNLLPTACRRP